MLEPTGIDVLAMLDYQQQTISGDVDREPLLRPAVIVSFDLSTGLASGLFDGDTDPVAMISLVPVLAAGTRVFVLRMPPSGNYILAPVGGGGVSGTYPRMIARHERTTSSTQNSAAQGVIRIDDIPVPAGHLITAHTNSLILFSTVALDNPSARLAYLLGGGSAGTGDTLFGLWNSPDIISVGDGAGGMVTGKLPVQTTATVASILLYTVRVAGSGNVSIFATNNFPTELRVIDWGPDVGSTGVDII